MDKIKHELYAISATAVDGRNGRVTSESGRLTLDLSVPAGMGGPGENKTNPEELFACGYAACFCGAIEFVAGQRGIQLNHPEVKATVHFGKNENGFVLAVDIAAKLDGVSDEVAQELVDAAHEQVCPYSKATRNNIEVRTGLLSS